MATNGQLPDSDLSAIPGGRLRKDAAGSWLAMRAYIGKSKNVWICPTSVRTAYRPYADQEYFWRVYQGGGALAARPGTSNHGWGIAVDIPSAAMQAAVRECGHQFGWGIRGGRLPSDAPSEAWHCTYHPGTYSAVGQNKPKEQRQHPYHVLTEGERKWRNILVTERRIARRNGGWKKVDASHLARAVEAKKMLRKQMRRIAKAADGSGGWKKNDRRARYDYIKKLVSG